MTIRSRYSILTALICAALALAGIGASSAAAASTPGSFTLLRPYNNQKISGKVKVRTAIKSSVLKSVWGVEFWLDGKRFAVDRKAPFTANLNTAGFTNGEHKLSLVLVTKKSNKKPAKGPNKMLCSYTGTILVRINNAAPLSANVKTVAGAPSVAAQPKKAAVPAGIVTKNTKWNMVFRDEFDGTALDNAKWDGQRDDWMTGGNPFNDREDAWYLPANNTVGGGVLTQTVRHETQGSYNLTTGMVNSNHRFAFKYGYVEARVNVPSCDGCWPVFWTLPDGGVWPPEMDIFEYIDTTSSQRSPFFASHWSENGIYQSNLSYYPKTCGTATDYTGSYHRYGLLWTPTKIQPYLDGVPGPTFTGAAVPQASMYLVLMLSLADGANPAGSPAMKTDYVRVWQQSAK
ncbi:MAG: family 16 glycosylhydrolase [Solirubrobacterales bacterium]